MRVIASAGASGGRPARLMQRLALLGRPVDDPEPADERRPRTGLFFALGIIGGALAGAAALLALELVWGMQLRDVGNRSLGILTAALAPMVASTAAHIAHAAPTADVPASLARPAQQPEIFDVAIDRRVKFRAPFGLRLVGSDDRRVEVLLRDLPKTAVLSHGKRQNASSWVVGAADLGDLHLTLADGTPDAFDIRIDVLARADIAGVSSVARVRLVDVPGREPAPMVAAVEQRDVVPAAIAAAEPQMHRAMMTAPVRVRVGEDKSRSANPAPPAAARRHWPEGASALGAAIPSTERQVWWKMPLPGWSPFPEQALHNLP
jgi:hypothetical protein